MGVVQLADFLDDRLDLGFAHVVERVHSVVEAVQNVGHGVFVEEGAFALCEISVFAEFKLVEYDRFAAFFVFQSLEVDFQFFNVELNSCRFLGGLSRLLFSYCLFAFCVYPRAKVYRQIQYGDEGIV